MKRGLKKDDHATSVRLNVPQMRAMIEEMLEFAEGDLALLEFAVHLEYAKASLDSMRALALAATRDDGPDLLCQSLPIAPASLKLC